MQVTRLADRPNRFARGFAQRSPQVLGLRVVVGMSLQVERHSLPEVLVTKEGVQHPNDRGSFLVADVVKDLIDLRLAIESSHSKERNESTDTHLRWMLDWHFDRVTAVQGIKTQGCEHGF